MKVFDMHIHSFNSAQNPVELLKRMEEAGIFGGCVFSNEPKLPRNMRGTIFEDGTSFDERMDEVLSWTKGFEDRLFPVIWIHPDEENLIENIHRAVEKGICGFKIICNDFYVYEEKCMKVLREIARLDKPVFFHSGILWDSGVSSQYNRPLNWEALLEIEGLRFSMGHCSWPWIDECIALYGKFLNSLQRRNTAEMFFDITPGTPEIYREELLTKLFTIGYDVGDNIMFGTDATINNYSSDWASKWLIIDGEIMDRLGVSKKYRERLYYENLLRFLGKSAVKKVHTSPESDDAHEWSPCNDETKEIIKKWYQKLGFSKKYDEEFYEAVENIKISDAISIEDYDTNSKDGKRNLLSYLFMCEELEKRYRKKGIDESILIDTLKDIPIWTNIWSGLKGELWLEELPWLKRHLEMRLFKLGRLQFCMAKAEHDIGDKISDGENMVEIYIPECGPLDVEECRKSIKMAKEFFEKFYPEYDFKYFTCHTWLLDKTLKELLRENSNILKFQELFDVVSDDKSDAILGYVFRWKADRDDIKTMPSSSKFSQKVKERILNGGDFFETMGIIDKKNID